MKKYLLVLLLFVVSCSIPIKPDPSMPAIDANYPTAEIEYDGKIFHGMKVISVRKGEDLSKVDVFVRGYYEGVVKIDGKRCQISESSVYSKFGKIRIPFQGEASTSCVVGLLVSPKYPNADDVVTSGFPGFVYLKVLDEGDSWVGKEVKVGHPFTKTISVKAGGESAKVFFRGCGINADFSSQVVDGEVKFDVNQIAENRSQICVAEGLVQTETEEKLVSVLVARYVDDFIPLAIPSVEPDGNKLCITSDPVVSLVILFSGDSIDEFGSDRTCVKVKNGDSIRAITAGGRSAIGVVGEDFVWSNLQ